MRVEILSRIGKCVLRRHVNNARGLGPAAKHERRANHGAPDQHKAADNAGDNEYSARTRLGSFLAVTRAAVTVSPLAVRIAIVVVVVLVVVASR